MPYSDIVQTKQKCLEKWKGEFEPDKKLREIQMRYDEWFMQIPEQYQPIVQTLLENLEYYSKQTTNRWLCHLHNEMISNHSITDENTVYAFIKSSDGKSNSSNDYWTEYKAINEINAEICYENMDEILDWQWEFIKNIVFIDDFSGSGKSFLDELKKHSNRYIGKNVFFVAINIMVCALDQIQQFACDNGIHICLIIAHYQTKAFEKNLFDDDCIAKEKIVQMSSDFNIPSCHQLGFKNTQALIAFHNNTPNNTLGFIRFDTDDYKSLFPRRNDKKPSWQIMRNKRSNRAKANYNNAVRSVE